MKKLLTLEKVNLREIWKHFNNKIPRQPQSFYKNKGWKGWADFLGKEK